LRYAARVDATQAEIVDALRKAGATVWVLGLPVDLLCGYRGKTLLIECKIVEGLRKPKVSGYTLLQERFLEKWSGGPVATVTDAEGALRALKMLECGSG
jgi:hypothetical protein